MAGREHVSVRISFVLVLSLGFQQVCAWSPVAHMVIAQLALSQMTPDASRRAEHYLASFDQFHHKHDFVTASVWATEIKIANNRLFDTWHYVSLPIVDGQPAAMDSMGKNDIIFAIEECLELLRANETDAQGWMFASHLLIHLVGDIHQPLHCVSRRTPLNGPAGDLGGSQVALSNSPVPNSPTLHKFWDNAAGIFDDVEVTGGDTPGHLLTANRGQISAAAADLHSSFQASGDIADIEIENENVTTWAFHGRDLAIEGVYAGSVKTSIDDTDPGWPVNVDGTYLAYSKAVSKRQVALAAYRLARIFNELYASRPDDREYPQYWVENAPPRGSIGAGWITALLILLALAIAAAVGMYVLLQRERKRVEKDGRYNNLGHNLGGSDRNLSFTGEELGGGRMSANSSMDDIYGKADA